MYRFFRGSMFISLLLIMSVTLSGCSFNLLEIFNGIKGFIGNLASKIGNFIAPIVDIAKDIFDVARDVVGSVVEGLGDVFRNLDINVDKVYDTIDDAEDITDKIGDAGDAIGRTGDKILASTAPLDEEEDRPNRKKNKRKDNEWLNDMYSSGTDRNRQYREISDNPKLPSQVKEEEQEVMTESEKQAAAAKIRQEAKDLGRAVDNIYNEISELPISMLERKRLADQYISIKRAIGTICKNPMSIESNKALQNASEDLERFVDKAIQMSDSSKSLYDAIQILQKEAEDLSDAL